ncbi:SWIM zinc finger family protein [Streptomyces thinghirensis]|uniref:SWIM zinc finger family protein n=1 Tax=Streptomyces thinghirensis TaxID=551547 RepID=A0ABP9SZW4_9ACTN
MTPRPADEARRALREARERGEGAAPTPTVEAEAEAEAGADAPEREPAPAQAQGHDQYQHQHQHQHPDRGRNRDRKPEERTERPRPGDVARAALRSARTARHAGEDDGAGGETGEETNRPEDVTRSAGRPIVSDGTTVATPVDHSDDAAAAASASASDPTSLPGEATADAAPAARPGSAGASDSRPADVAREALRAARRQATADTAAKGAEGTRRLSHPARRPQGGGGSRTADARARAVRDFAADAFRLPPEADPDEDALTPDELASDSTPTPYRAARSEVAAEGPTPAAGEPWLPALPSTSSYEPPPPRRQAPPRPGRAPAAPDRAPHPAAHDQTSPPPPATQTSSPPPATQTSSPPPATQTSSPPPATPRTPRSMAAPGRDGELRRTFPALPPRAAADGSLAGTWWGNAWVTALEEGALDAARLARGRGYAERGHVDAITVTPGLVLAYVQGSRPRPYRVQMRLRTLDDADWERFLDAAVERPGHIAALLDKELPHSLADCGVPLLPGPGDLAPQCSCPDSGHPCKHAAALCYQTARLLDADPFVLLLLRGRGERELLDALSRLNAARAARAAQDRGPAPLPGVRAAAALTARALPPLPAPLPPPPHPEQPPAYPAAPGGPDPFALDQLATDAAARAHALLITGRDPVGGLTLWQDAVRLAAARPGSGLTVGTRALYASLAKAAGRDTADLARAVAAWRQGGPEGLDVLEEPWDPPAGRFDRARPLLLAADLPAFRPWRNRLTHPQGHVQLRLGRAGLWYAYESEPGRDDWWPRGTPDLDPVGALTGLGGPGDL